MPGIDGPAVLANLRERGLRTRVILLTGESCLSVIRPLLDLGVDDYILKPCKADELLGKVRKSLAEGGLPKSP